MGLLTGDSGSSAGEGHDVVIGVVLGPILVIHAHLPEDGAQRLPLGDPEWAHFHTKLADQHDALRREYESASNSLIQEMRAVESTVCNATYHTKDELIEKLKADRQHFGTTISELRTILQEGFSKLERKQLILMKKTRKIEGTICKRSVYLGKRSHEDMASTAQTSSSSGNESE